MMTTLLTLATVALWGGLFADLLVSAQREQPHAFHWLINSRSRGDHS